MTEAPGGGGWKFSFLVIALREIVVSLTEAPGGGGENFSLLLP
ncbi:hypothetical protein [Okeania sp. SIO3I5]|nr:hypothetical protein [Okeania sp. SIO3I5]